MMRYFVALIHPTGGWPMVIVEEEPSDKTALLNSRESAEHAMRDHRAAQAWGYEIIEWPYVAERWTAEERDE